MKKESRAHSQSVIPETSPAPRLGLSKGTASSRPNCRSSLVAYTMKGEVSESLIDQPPGPGFSWVWRSGSGSVFHWDIFFLVPPYLRSKYNPSHVHSIASCSPWWSKHKWMYHPEVLPLGKVQRRGLPWINSRSYTLRQGCLEKAWSPSLLALVNIPICHRTR